MLGDVSFVSLNWDPIGLWMQFVANRELNRSANVPHIGAPACKLRIFHDLGHFVAGPRVDKQHQGSRVWQPMNESSARQMNDPDHGANLRVRVGKYLFPHGCLWWRECPNCGKLSSFIGDEWEADSETLLPSPPLKAFCQHFEFQSWMRAGEDDERIKWRNGRVDARACVHCKTMTYAHHTPLVTQTNFKTRPPPFIEEIQREMRVVVQNADHIVFMGYSLPSDDVTYRAFFAARMQRSKPSDVRCSVVDMKTGFPNRWMYPEELNSHRELPDVLKATRGLFGSANVRYFGAGVPDVFLEGEAGVTDHAVHRLLNWDSR